MSEIKELSQFFMANFGFELNDESATLEFIKLRLKAIVQELLLKDHQRLLDLLYRIDVSESATNQAFSLGIPDKIAERIAEAIIERQLKKLAYRQNLN